MPRKSTKPPHETEAADRASHLNLITVAMRVDPDPATNRARLGQLIEQAKHEHPDVRLIHFGETTLGWFNRETRQESIDYHREIAEEVPGPTTAMVTELATRLDLYVSFGLTERAGEKVYNTQVLIDPAGEIIARHRKFWLRTPYFEPGERALTLAQVDGVRVVLVICADVRSLWLMRAIRRAHADLVLASLADNETDPRVNRMMGSFYDAWNVVANRYGEEPHNTWGGLITVTDRWARMRALRVGKEQMLAFRVPIGRSRAMSRAVRRAFVFGKLVWLAGGYGLRALGASVRRKRRKG
jgi:predicted amidohydrolase